MFIDSVADDVTEKLYIGALIGGSNVAKEDRTAENFNFVEVYYSSDYALCTDENQMADGSYLGTNLSATTIYKTPKWQEKLKKEEEIDHGIWQSKQVAGQRTIVPYLNSLEEKLVEFGILTTDLDYVEGSAMKPVEVHAYDLDTVCSFNQDVYKYYLLIPAISLNRY